MGGSPIVMVFVLLVFQLAFFILQPSVQTFIQEKDNDALDPALSSLNLVLQNPSNLTNAKQFTIILFNQMNNIKAPGVLSDAILASEKIIKANVTLKKLWDQTWDCYDKMEKATIDASNNCKIIKENPKRIEKIEEELKRIKKRKDNPPVYIKKSTNNLYGLEDESNKLEKRISKLEKELDIVRSQFKTANDNQRTADFTLKNAENQFRETMIQFIDALVHSLKQKNDEDQESLKEKKLALLNYISKHVEQLSIVSQVMHQRLPEDQN